MCTRIHVYAYAHSGHTYACLLHEHTCTGMCTQLGFHKLCKESFFAIKLVWNKSHIVWEPPQAPFFLLYKAIKETFSKEEKKGGKNIEVSLENSESKGDFFTKHPQVKFCLIVTFSGLNFRVLSSLIHF